MIFSLSPLTYAEENKFETSAPSALLMEAESGRVLFEKNSSEVRYVASLMKMMNIIAAFEAIEEGKINLNDKVKINKDFPKMSGSNIWIKPGDTLTVKDLLKAIAMISADDASLALAQHICKEEGKFVSEINELASRMNLNNTIFKNCIGEDKDGNVSSACDIAKMALELYHTEEALKYTSKWIDHIRNGKSQIVNTNKLLKTYPGTIGLKTGTSENAGSCICALAKKNDFNLIAVVLGCKDVKERNEETKKILDYGFSEYQMTKLSLPEDFPKQIKVSGGMEDYVDISAIIPSPIPILNKSKNKITSQPILEEKVEAPVERGKKVGQVIYRQNEEILCTYDVIAKTSVPKKEFLPLIKRMVKNFLKM